VTFKSKQLIPPQDYILCLILADFIFKDFAPAILISFYTFGFILKLAPFLVIGAKTLTDKDLFFFRREVLELSLFFN